jgi:16S rRNA (guanine527-N7)-methyltransferase
LRTVNSSRIASLLEPFLERPLSPAQLDQTSIYVDLLLRWNARINLTAVRNPEEIVTRHFGESFFLARHVFSNVGGSPEPDRSELEAGSSERFLDRRPQTAQISPAGVIDLGSGAGFPGLPLKIWEPEIQLTLIESNHKKAAFLREVVRALTLMNVDVIAERGECLADQLPEDSPAATSPDTLLSNPLLSNARSPGTSSNANSPISSRSSTIPGAKPTITKADVVTFRAVENFERTLFLAVRFLAPYGHLAILISAAQLPHLSGTRLPHLPTQGDPACQIPAQVADVPASIQTGTLHWHTIHVPKSHQRVLALAEKL